MTLYEYLNFSGSAKPSEEEDEKARKKAERKAKFKKGLKRAALIAGGALAATGAVAGAKYLMGNKKGDKQQTSTQPKTQEVSATNTTVKPSTTPTPPKKQTTSKPPKTEEKPRTAPTPPKKEEKEVKVATGGGQFITDAATGKQIPVTHTGLNSREAEKINLAHAYNESKGKKSDFEHTAAQAARNEKQRQAAEAREKNKEERQQKMAENKQKFENFVAESKEKSAARKEQRQQNAAARKEQREQNKAKPATPVAPVVAKQNNSPYTAEQNKANDRAHFKSEAVPRAAMKAVEQQGIKRGDANYKSAVNAAIARFGKLSPDAIKDYLAS